jgi:hypothetical protein
MFGGILVLKKGIVSSIDTASNKAKVFFKEFNAVVTAELPFLYDCNIKVNDVVAVCFFKDNFYEGIIIGKNGKVSRNVFGDFDNGNYLEIEDDGSLNLHGNATGWKDENLSATLTAVGVNAPGLINWDTSNIKVPAFPNNNTKELNFLKEFDHAAKTASGISFHAHVYPTTAASGSIKFYLEFYIKNANITAITGTLSNSVSTNSLAWEELKIDFAPVQNAILTVGTQIGARLYRLNTDPGSYAENVAVSTWGYHYEIDSLGSKEITVK